MADTIVRLVMTTKGVKEGAQEFQNFEKTSTRAMSSAEASVASSLGRIAAQYLSLGIAINKGIKAMSTGVEFNKFVETQTMAFTVMMKSAEKAKAQMKDLYDFAVESPLTFKETASSAKQLMAYGFTAKELIPTMDRLGTVALATGHSLGDIAYVYGTLKSQGRAYSRDLMQFGMRGIPIYEELATVMGVTTDKIQKMASEGKIGFKEVEQAFMNMTSGSGRFAGIIDGHMETLTGKMSMLEDIAEQYAGTLMSGVTDQLKVFVDALTDALSSDAFRDMLSDLSNGLAAVASVLGGVLTVVIKLLPLLTALLKLVIGFLVIKTIYKLIAGIPAILMAISAAATTATASLAAFGTGAAYASALSMGIASATTAVRGLTTAFTAFATANPWLLALIGIAAVGGAIITIVQRSVAADKTSADRADRIAALTGEYGMYTGKKGFVAPAEIAKIASEYQLSEEETAKILINQMKISERAWDTYKAHQAIISLQKEMSDEKAFARAQKSVEQLQAVFLSSLTGLDVDRYYDPDDVFALGMRGANDYIQSFSAQMEAQKKLYGEAFTPDMEVAQWNTEYTALSKALEAGADVPKLFEETNFDETIIARLVELNKLIEGSGKAVKDLKPPADLGTWWEPLIQAAKMTETAVDDIRVSYAKHIEDVNKEANARKENLELQKAATTDAELQAELQFRILGVELLRKQMNEDLTEEMKKQIELAKIQEGAAKFDKMIGGDSEYFDKLKADIFASREAGKNGEATFSGTMGMLGDTAKLATQGTEVGSMMAGGDPVMMLIMSLAEAATSIENVSKLLNPIGTVLDAMFSVLEPFINSALQPFINLLEMAGERIGKMLAPLFSLSQILHSVVYAALMPFEFMLQLVGAAFVWLNDSVIAPFGNKFIDMMNGVIRALNKIPFVSIRYLDHINLLSKATASLADRMNLAKDSLSASIDYLSNKINKVADKELDKLQELYEVGAISGAEYEQRQKQIVKADFDNLNVGKKYLGITDVNSMWSSLEDLLEAQLEISKLGDKGKPEEIKAILDAIGIDYTEKTQAQLMYESVLGALVTYGAAQTKYQSEEDAEKHWIDSAFDMVKYAKSLPSILAVSAKKLMEAQPNRLLSRAVGTPSLPRDMPIFAHKGEGIIPATFMDGIRSGELSLSGGKNQGTGQNIYVTVNVQGSVTTEEELSDAVARTIYQRRSTGVLTY